MCYKKGAVIETAQIIKDEYIDIISPILNTDIFRSMTQYNHHGIIDTHFHSVHVSYYVYDACIKMRFNSRKTSDITQAALLHDFYLYNWYTDKHDEWHAFYHPKQAVKNIEKYALIPLTEMQRKMILTHMFPLGKIPVSAGGWLLTVCDKLCAAEELVRKGAGFKNTYNIILGKAESND